VLGSDSRLTNARTPSSTLAHAASHAAAGGDPVTLSESQVTGLVSDLAAKATTAGTLAQFAATTSAQLAGVISDKTGSGSLVFGTGPIITPGASVAATAASQAGYMGMPQLSKSASYTLALGDAGKHVYMTTTGQTLTIPANSATAFEIGTTFVVVNASAVTTTIAITTDTLYLAGAGTTGSRTLAAFGMATIVKITATSWIISGNGLT
jgi:hypothetical protein